MSRPQARQLCGPVQTAASVDGKAGILDAFLQILGKTDRKAEGAAGYSYKETWTTAKRPYAGYRTQKGNGPHPTMATAKGSFILSTVLRSLGFRNDQNRFIVRSGAQESRPFLRPPPVTTGGAAAFKKGMHFLSTACWGNKMLVYKKWLSPPQPGHRLQARAAVRRIGSGGDALSKPG